jgi:hypothetical protein
MDGPASTQMEATYSTQSTGHVATTNTAMPATLVTMMPLGQFTCPVPTETKIPRSGNSVGSLLSKNRFALLAD